MEARYDNELSDAVDSYMQEDVGRLGCTTNRVQELSENLTFSDKLWWKTRESLNKLAVS